MTGRSTTGFPSPADPFRERALDLNDLVAPNPASTFFMRVSAGLHQWRISEGDILVVDRSLQPVRGELAVVSSEGSLALSETASDSAPVWGTVRGVIRIFRGAPPKNRFTNGKTPES